MAKKTKFYVVWQGRATGIFRDWASCEAQVKGFAGAKYKSFASLEQAQHAFADTADNHIGKERAKKLATTSQHTLAKQPRDLPSDVILPSWAVDAACEGNPGKMEYRIVHTHDGSTVQHSPLFTRGTNNIGEFLALVEALQQREAAGIAAIYTDSRTALAWLRQAKANTTLARNSQTETLWARLEQAEAWLQRQDIPNLLSYVYKWQTRQWGEIPADFGRK